MIKELNPSTKKAQQFIRNYNNHKKELAYSLSQIYGHCSQAKQYAYKNCIDIKVDFNGRQACFCGHNCDAFNYGFLFEEDLKTYLMYITKDNCYKILYER